MRWREMAVLGAAALTAGGCGLIGEDDGGMEALSANGQQSVEAAAPTETIAPSSPSSETSILQVVLDPELTDDPIDDGTGSSTTERASDQTATSSTSTTALASTPTSTPASSPTSTPTPTSTPASSTTAAPTTAAPTTAAPTTRPPTTTTTRPPTTTTTTTSSGETREQVRLLDGLATFGGGSFSADSYAGRNIVLWFWGAH